MVESTNNRAHTQWNYEHRLQPGQTSQSEKYAYDELALISVGNNQISNSH